MVLRTGNVRQPPVERTAAAVSRSALKRHAIAALALASVLSIDAAIDAPLTLTGRATESQRQAWVLQAAGDLPARAVATLQRIEGADRRLLAVRAYLRAGSSLEQRWSWSQRQLDAYPRLRKRKPQPPISMR